MGTRLWGTLSLLALFSAFLVGCNNGPEKHKGVASQGKAPNGSALATPAGTNKAFPTVPAKADVGQQPPVLPLFPQPGNGPGAGATLPGQPNPGAPSVLPTGNPYSPGNPPPYGAGSPAPLNPPSTFGTGNPSPITPPPNFPPR